MTKTDDIRTSEVNITNDHDIAPLTARLRIRVAIADSNATGRTLVPGSLLEEAADAIARLRQWLADLELDDSRECPADAPCGECWSCMVLSTLSEVA